MMSTTGKPRGHLQVKGGKNGRGRTFHAFWWDAEGKHGRCLGPAHVRDTGRRTARKAVIWRAGDGPKPTPEHVTPKEAEDLLDDILREAEASAQTARKQRETHTLRETLEGWVAERTTNSGLKASTLHGYDTLFGRMYRDFGADTPVDEIAAKGLVSYFEELTALKALGNKAAQAAIAEGREVVQVDIPSWTAQPPGSQAVEVATKAEALQLADAMPGTWKHRRRGAYRVVPLNAPRAKRVPCATAQTLKAQGWVVRSRTTTRWVEHTPPSAATFNRYRDIFGAALDYAVRRKWIDANPMDEVPRRSNKAARQQILRREDFYVPAEVDRLLEHAPGPFEEAFWLCGAHAGLRLPGEGLGLKWGMVDFEVEVIRPYGNWILNQDDSTKTEFTPIPMTRRLTNALRTLKQREHWTGDDDYVFAGDSGRPVSAKHLRELFVVAALQAELKQIPMYNLRHSFGTALAASGKVPSRTIQALMRHSRLSTTEIYMAYAPQPELAHQLTLALEPDRPLATVTAIRPVSGNATPAFLERLEEEIPAKWLREVARVYAESEALQTA